MIGLLDRILSWPLRRLGDSLFGKSFGEVAIEPAYLPDEDIEELLGDADAITTRGYLEDRLRGD